MSDNLQGFLPTEYSVKMYWMINEQSGKPYMRMFFPLCGAGFAIYFYPESQRLVLVNRDRNKNLEDDKDVIFDSQVLVKNVSILMEIDENIIIDNENSTVTYIATVNFCGALYDIDVITPEMEFGKAKRGCFGTLRIRKA